MAVMRATLFRGMRPSDVRRKSRSDPPISHRSCIPAPIAALQQVLQPAQYQQWLAQKEAMRQKVEEKLMEKRAG